MPAQRVVGVNAAILDFRPAALRIEDGTF